MKKKPPKKPKQSKVIEIYPGLTEDLRGMLTEDIFQTKEFLIRLCEEKKMIAGFVWMENGSPMITPTKFAAFDAHNNMVLRKALEDCAFHLATDLDSDSVIFTPSEDENDA
jgi:hypothetical protein